jgi:formylmethanofuran dehydrogenase subunit E
LQVVDKLMWGERKKSGKMVCWLYLKAKNAEYKITIAKKKNNCKSEKSRNMRILTKQYIPNEGKKLQIPTIQKERTMAVKEKKMIIEKNFVDNSLYN